MSAPNGSRFQVVYSQRVLNSLKSLHGQAKQKGQAGKLLDALRKIVTSLRERPDQYGEPRFTLPHLNLEVRVAVEPPLVVEFGVHRQKAIVFVRQFLSLLA